jgi:hypothetical protein
VIHAQFHPGRRGLGEHEHGGGLELAVQHIGRAGGLEPQGPPGLAPRAELSEFHRASRPLARSRDVCPGEPVGQGEPADPALLADPPPAGRVTAGRTRRVRGKGPLLPGLQAAAGAPGHLEETRAAAVRLHLKRPSRAYLHRQPGQVRIQEIDVVEHRRLGGETPEPSGHRRRQPAGEDPAHLQAVDSFVVPALRRRGRHRPRPRAGRAAAAGAGTARHANHGIRGGRLRWGRVAVPLDLTDDGGHVLAPNDLRCRRPYCAGSPARPRRPRFARLSRLPPVVLGVSSLSGDARRDRVGSSDPLQSSGGRLGWSWTPHTSRRGIVHAPFI